MAFGFQGKRIPGIGRRLTIKEFSDVFSIPVSEIQKHHKTHGCPKVVKTGSATLIEMPEWIRWYTQQVRLDERQDLYTKHNIQEDHQEKESSGMMYALEKQSEEMKLLKAKTKKAELEAGVLDGTLVYCNIVREQVLGACHKFVSLLNAVPGRMANRLAGIDTPAEVREELFKEVNMVRENVHDTMDQLSFHLPTVQRDGADFQATTFENSGPVGG